MKINNELVSQITCLNIWPVTISISNKFTLISISSFWVITRNILYDTILHKS